MQQSTKAQLAFLVTLAGVLVTGCGPRRISPPTPPAPTLIVLLADSGDGTTGRARVSNEYGSANLTAERDAITATADRRPGPVSTMTEADVERLFGEALAALPPAPRGFTLYFKFESDELTDESRALVPEVLKSVKGLAVPEVVVVGHTDTLGTRRANVELGLKRATTVRNFLMQAGLDASMIEVTSHGEGNLLVRTPNNTPEPRNRRVEITVR